MKQKKNRTESSIKNNGSSCSKSTLIMMVRIKQNISNTEVKKSVLNFVDLAGVEKRKILFFFLIDF